MNVKNRTKRCSARFEQYRKVLLEAVIPMAYQEMGGSTAQMLSMLAHAGDWTAVSSVKFDPMRYSTAEDAQKAFQAIELVRKAAFLPGQTADSRRRNALQAFLAAEDQCSRTNRAIAPWREGFEVDPRVAAIIPIAQRKIAFVLGRFSESEMWSSARWSGGSDLSSRRPHVSSYHKYSAVPTGTAATRPYLDRLRVYNPTWSAWLTDQRDAPRGASPVEVTRVIGNRYTTVPKDADKDRSICVEPSLNVHLQLGVGAMIRKRLLKVGIDLNTQDLNRELALDGSSSAHWATIDLSSASDTVSRVLVDILLDHNPAYPSEGRSVRKWFKVLDDLRSKFTEIDGQARLNAKFSSMGNGYTFELETLIFWALAAATCEWRGSGVVGAVYGDDIIVTNDCFDDVVLTLQAFGFTINQKKSYATSEFRESCGMNAFRGVSLDSFKFSDCDGISTDTDDDSWRDVAQLYSWVNGLRRIGCHKAATKLLSLIRRDRRFYGPEELGDAVLYNPNISTWRYRIVRGDGWFFTGLDIKSLRWEADTEPVGWRLQPALLHSWSGAGVETEITRALGPRFPARTYGTQGLVTLAEGKYRTGRTRVVVGGFRL